MLNELLTTTLVLTLPVEGENFMVDCDASHVGMGCVLIQKGLVIVYGSHHL